MSTQSLTAKSSYLLVVIRWAGKVYRYTNQSSAVKGYKSVPNMGLEPAAMLGTLDPEVWSLELPADELSDALLGNGSKALAFVTVTEVVLDSRLLNAQSVVKHSGLVAEVAASPGGKRGWVRYKVSNDKQALDMEPGYTLLETCDNVLYGNGCEVLKSLHTFPATLVSFNPTTRQAVITGFPLPNGLLYFTAGNVSRQGSLVDIRFWTRVDPQVFHLAQLVPPEWVGQQVELVAGCIRTREVCEESFNNLDNFNGIGIKVPNYNPQFETGGA